jgi:hypothetical protein
MRFTFAIAALGLASAAFATPFEGTAVVEVEDAPEVPTSTLVKVARSATSPELAKRTEYVF